MTRETWQFTTQDDVQLCADRWPKRSPGPGPGMVLLHAGVCDRRSWYATADQLDEVGPVVAYDRRGFGQTPVSPGPFRHLDDLVAVLDQSFDEPVWLIGSSMGGGLALDAAIACPERVAGLVLLAPAVSGAPGPVEVDPGTQRLSDLIDLAEADGDLSELNRHETHLWLDGPAGPEGRVSGPARELALAMNAVVLANAAAEHDGATEREAWPELPDLLLPVTVAWGDLDLPLLAARSHQLTGLLPLGHGRILPGTAHLPYLEQPGLVLAVIREAVTSVVPAI